jgi:hypothetical protein
MKRREKGMLFARKSKRKLVIVVEEYLVCRSDLGKFMVCHSLCTRLGLA